MHRLYTFSLAFWVGWLVYMIAVVMTFSDGTLPGYEGLLSMLIQPIVGMACSAIALLLALLLGLMFKIPLLGRFWNATPVPAVLLIVGSLVLLCFGSQFGLGQSYPHPGTDQPYTGLRMEAALISYFTLIFAIAHWPINRHFTARRIEVSRTQS